MLTRSTVCAFMVGLVGVNEVQGGEPPASGPARGRSDKPGQASSRPAASTQPAGGWTMFRGDPRQTGVAASGLPDRLDMRWRFQCEDAVVSTAAIAGGVVYVGSDDGHLYALSLDSGDLKWKYATKAAVRSSPTLVEGLVIFGDDDGVLHAVDARDGSVRWNYKTDAEIISSANHDRRRIVFGSYDGFLYCVSVRDGMLTWKYETQDRVHGTPGVADGFAMTAGCDGRLHVVDTANGQAARTVELGSVSGASAAIRGDRVFIGTYGNQVLGIDWRAGKVVWTFEDKERPFPFMSSAAVTDALAVIGGRDKRVRALDLATGAERWAFVTRGRVESSPVVAGDRVFVGSQDGCVYGLRIADGQEVWRYECGAPISASPAVADGRLVIGTEDGTIYCFGAAE